jgi:hypothetical protein
MRYGFDRLYKIQFQIPRACSHLEFNNLMRPRCKIVSKSESVIARMSWLLYLDHCGYDLTGLLATQGYNEFSRWKAQRAQYV